MKSIILFPLLLELLLVTLATGQETTSSNDDSPVLLTLSQPDKPIHPADELDDVITNDKDISSTSSPTPATKATARPFIIPIALQTQPTARPSLIQAFLAGRSGAGTSPRPSRLQEAVRNINFQERFAKLRERIGRFRLPPLMTSESSFTYRAGRQIGLFLQNIGKRARALAERLRARASTATPVAT